MGVKYDFSGWATRNGIKCSDGRTIMHNAFKDCDGMTVPLVWNHQHNEASNVLGHALLENRDEGVYTYCSFNDSEAGQNAKLLVKHGDVKALSIYANNLKQHGSDVLHGAIREVSLVLAGANPGAFIDNVVLAHSDEVLEDEAVIYTGMDLELAHSDTKDEEEEKPEEKEEPKKEETKEQPAPEAKPEEKNEEAPAESEEKEKEKEDMENEEKLEHADKGGDKTVKEVFDSLTEDQKTVVYAMIGQVAEDAKKNNDSDEEDNNMKHNVFTQDEMNNEAVLSHADIETIFADAKRSGSLKDSFFAHAAEYGIENIDFLFPEAKTIENRPEFISRRMDWVQKVMSSVHHTPFSRVKTVFADITADEARAKGYIKGKLKKEEVFALLKRQTLPTTVYKKQKLDRDDVIDITDFDVVAWLKSEMRMMLDEELAGAFLIGDRRSSLDPDKIQEQNIRPIMNDADLYSVKVQVQAPTEEDKPKNFIKAAIRARKDYKGSGNPTLYCTEDIVTECLLLEDGIGHRLYEDEKHLATALRVKEIVTVPVMEGVKRTGSDGKERELAGIIVNLDDYNVGADKGGAIAMFDDFDIDYNQMKYLIETRCSGALIKPYSAIVLEFDEA